MNFALSTWLHQISQGVDTEQVMARQTPKSIGCSKNFRGKQSLNTISKVISILLTIKKIDEIDLKTYAYNR